MADLSELFKYAPTTAGYMLGGQLASQDKTDALNQQGKQISNNLEQQNYDQNTRMNPLKVQYQQGLNDKQGAELPGIIADSSLKAGTVNSNIAATNSKNTMQVNNDATMDSERKRRAVTEAALQLDGVADPLERATKMAGILKSHNIDINGDPLMQGIANMAITDPDRFIAHSNAIDRRTATNSSSYLAATDAARIHNEGTAANTAAEWQARREINDSQIAAGRWKGKEATTIDQSIDKEGDPAKKYTMLIDAASRMRYTNPEMAAHYMERAEAIRPAAQARLNTQPRPGQVDLPGTTNGGISANPSIDIRPPTQPAAPQPQSNAYPAPTPAHIQHLRQNPSLRAAFDAKFGPGASNSILGN